MSSETVSQCEPQQDGRRRIDPPRSPRGLGELLQCAEKRANKKNSLPCPRRAFWADRTKARPPAIGICPCVAQAIDGRGLLSGANHSRSRASISHRRCWPMLNHRCREGCHRGSRPHRQQQAERIQADPRGGRDLWTGLSGSSAHACSGRQRGSHFVLSRHPHGCASPPLCRLRRRRRSSSEDRRLLG